MAAAAIGVLALTGAGAAAMAGTHPAPQDRSTESLAPAHADHTVGTSPSPAGPGHTAAAGGGHGKPHPHATGFRNPLNGGPDPFMTTYQGNYYLSTTQGDAIRIWKAPSIGQLLTSPAHEVWKDTDGSRNQEMWAPEFYLINGHWYLYYTADDGTDAHHRLYVVESDGADPLGPYHFKAKLAVNNDQWAIDPSLMQRDGKLWIGFSSVAPQGHNSLFMAPLSDPWTVSGPSMYMPADGCPSDGVREAPEFLHHGNRTWLAYSSCDTGKPDYQLWMKSLDDGKDPMVAGNWVQHPGAVFTRNDDTGVFGPGHHTFFSSPDGKETWIAYGAKNTASYTYDWRTTRAQRIGFAADGTPDFGRPVDPSATQQLPSGDPGSVQSVVNDADGAVQYTGNGWQSGNKCGPTCLNGDDHWNSSTDGAATITFTGTQIALLGVRDHDYGIAGISVDGGPEAMVDLYSAIRAGQLPNWISPKLSAGRHTVKIRVTGQKNPASAGTVVEVDRAEIYG